MRFVYLLVVVALSGCIPYPIYKTLQPASTVEVRDSAGGPIAGATAELVANSYPYNRERTRSSATTDSQGIAQFEARKEWRIEAIMLHGAESFYWNWCVKKEGFETYATRNDVGDDPAKRIDVVLKPGASTKCPKYGF